MTVAAQSDHVGLAGVFVVVETARSLQVGSAEPLALEVDQSAQVGSTGSVEMGLFFDFVVVVAVLSCPVRLPPEEVVFALFSVDIVVEGQSSHVGSAPEAVVSAPLSGDVIVVVQSSHDWLVLTASFVEAAVVVTVQRSTVVLVQTGSIGVHQDGMDQLLVADVVVQVEGDELQDSEVAEDVVVIVDAVVRAVNEGDIVVTVLNAEFDAEASRRSSP